MFLLSLSRNLGRYDLHVMDHWCIVGDFNMLEDPSNRMGGSTVTISGTELAEWEKLCFKFNLQDYGLYSLLQEG